MADPGFLRREEPTPKGEEGGTPAYYFDQFFRKTA